MTEYIVIWLFGAFNGFCIAVFGKSAYKHWFPIIRRWIRGGSDAEDQRIVQAVLERATKPVDTPKPAPEVAEVPAVPENPTMDGFQLSEDEERAVNRSLRDAKTEYERVLALTPGDAGGMDLMTEVDKASREYAELYWAMYHKAPPEWG